MIFLVDNEIISTYLIDDSDPHIFESDYRIYYAWYDRREHDRFDTYHGLV